MKQAFRASQGAIALLASVLWVVGPAALADDFPFQIQRVTLDGGNYKPDGDGPFKDKYGAGGQAMKDANNSILKGTMFGTYDPKSMTFQPFPFGSDGYPNGVVFQNKAMDADGKAKDVEDIEIKMRNKVDTFKGSKGNGDFTVTEGKDANGFATLTVKAKAGKELKPNEYLWIKIPPAPKNVDPSRTKDWQFEGVLTPTPPKPAPPPPPLVPEKPKTPATGSGDGQKPDSSMNFDRGTGRLNFQTGPVGFARYADGSVVNANSSFESIIGTLTKILPTQLIGPSANAAGAFDFDPTLLEIALNGTIFLHATLGDLTLFPDSSDPRFDSVLTGHLVWDQSSAALGSRYLDEKNQFSAEDSIFFRTSLLHDTSFLTSTGSSVGTFEVASVLAAVPEPSTLALTGLGALYLLLRPRRRSACS